MMTPNKTDGTKCLKTLIRHHDVDVKSGKSIWLLSVGYGFFAFATWHGAFLCIKNYEFKPPFLGLKYKIKNLAHKISGTNQKSNSYF
jgi:hypothetical protein